MRKAEICDVCYNLRSEGSEDKVPCVGESIDQIIYDLFTRNHSTCF